MAIPFLSFRMRWMGAAAVSGALLLAVVVALGAGASSPSTALSAAGGAATQQKVGSSLASLAADKPEKHVEVIVRMKPGESTGAGHGSSRAMAAG